MVRGWWVWNRVSCFPFHSRSTTNWGWDRSNFGLTRSFGWRVAGWAFYKTHSVYSLRHPNVIRPPLVEFIASGNGAPHIYICKKLFNAPRRGSIISMTNSSIFPRPFNLPTKPLFYSKIKYIFIISDHREIWKKILNKLSKWKKYT